MPRDERGPEGSQQAADEKPMSYTPGAKEEKETASARANRTEQTDTTALRPERARNRDEDAVDRPGEHGDTRQAQQAAGAESVPPLDTRADPLR